MSDLITNQKEDWAKQFNFSGVMKGAPLQYNAAMQERYSKALVALSKQMTQQTQREIERFFTREATDGIAMDKSLASQARMLTNAINKKFSDMFAKRAKKLAEDMVAQANKGSSSSLHYSLKELSGGLSMKTTIMNAGIADVLTAQVAGNVALIKSIPQKYLAGVQEAVMRSITTGRGLQDLVPYMKKHEGITVRRARFIASDQSKKTYAAINRERSKAIGLKEFEWIHSGGGKEPRELHLKLDGQIFSYDEPPVINGDGTRGFPGDAPNCRCVARPIVKFNDGEAEA